MNIKQFRIVFTVLIALLIIGWCAAGNATPPKKGTNVTVNSHNQNDIDKSVKNWQGQEQSQEQSQDQANSQSIEFSSPKSIKIKNTPSPDAPSINPSAPCALVWTASATVAGFGGSGGKAYIDDACNAREWARLMFQMGARDAALYVMCQQPEAANVPDCKGVQDYNKELKMLSYAHDKLVDDNEKLRETNTFILSEREQDKARCDESVNRVGSELERCLQK